jgi:hypothetical protein
LARIVNRAALRTLDAWDAQSGNLFAQFVGWPRRRGRLPATRSRSRNSCAQMPRGSRRDPDVLKAVTHRIARGRSYRGRGL